MLKLFFFFQNVSNQKPYYFKEVSNHSKKIDNANTRLETQTEKSLPVCVACIFTPLKFRFRVS